MFQSSDRSQGKSYLWRLWEKNRQIQALLTKALFFPFDVDDWNPFLSMLTFHCMLLPMLTAL
jgi:hypothetical protein